MFRQNPFYHGIIRKAIVAFGEVFNDMTVRNKDNDNNVVKVKKVPISYAPKEKWFSRLHEDPDFAQKFQIELPRMSFEITDIQYDAQRKLNQQMMNNCPGAGKIFAPVPYNIGITLHTYTKTQEDALQILEQILPFFGPALIINIDVTDMNITQDIPITLNSIHRSDSYEGSLEDTRMILQQFNFEMKLNLYGPVGNKYNVIKEVIVDINSTNNITSVPMTNYNAEVNPRTANKEDQYTIDELWTDF